MILKRFKVICPKILQIPDYRNSVIVARNPGSAKKATSYAERLRLGIAVIHGEQKEAESDQVDGRYSPPPTRYFESIFFLLHTHRHHILSVFFFFAFNVRSIFSF